MNKKRKKQRGVTLIELIVALAIASAIGVAATMTAHNMITIPYMSNNSNTAINEVRSAVSWINRDVQGADPNFVNDAPASPGLFSISLQQWNSGVWITHNITYSLEDMAGTEMKQLWRDYDNGTKRNPIAQFIDPDNTSCSWDSAENILSVTITAAVSEETETRTFQVKTRLSE